MAKINFTKEHFNKMCKGLLAMLLNNGVVTTKLGTPINVVELLHTTTINSLNNIRLSLAQKITALENQDEWTSNEETTKKLENYKETKELVNLIIGYKRFKMEAEEESQKKANLIAKLNEIKESQKSPEDKIKEIEAELSNIIDTESF